jgi:hypothetical protein
MSGRKIHPVKGVIAGILFGFGLMMLLISLGVIPFGTNAPWLVFLIAFVATVLWSIFGPTRSKKGASAS